MKRKYIILLLILSISLSGCQLFFRVALGIDVDMDWYEDTDLSKVYRKRGIDNSQAFVLDTTTSEQLTFIEKPCRNYGYACVFRLVGK